MNAESRHQLGPLLPDKKPELISPKKVLVVVAHPDDAEINCGGTLVLWSKGGAEIVYAVCTDGSKGSWDQNIKPHELSETRKKEQRLAAELLGVQQIYFLDYEDGRLRYSEESLEKDLVFLMRSVRPDVVVTHDPWKLYEPKLDHISTGLIAVHSAMASSWPLFYPEQFEETGGIHFIPTICLFDTSYPNFWVDISETIEQKMESIRSHQSQFGTRQRFLEELKSTFMIGDPSQEASYSESFRVLTLS